MVRRRAQASPPFFGPAIFSLMKSYLLSWTYLCDPSGFLTPLQVKYLVLLLVPPLQVAEQTVQVVHSPTLQSTEKKNICFLPENELFITRQTRPLVASVGFLKVEDSASSKHSFFEDPGTCAHLAPVLGLVKFVSGI